MCSGSDSYLVVDIQRCSGCSGCSGIFNTCSVDFRYCGFTDCDFTNADLTDVKLTTKVGQALQLTPEQQSVIDWQSEDGDEPAGG